MRHLYFVLAIIISTLCSCTSNSNSREVTPEPLCVEIKLLKEYYVPDSIYIEYDYESRPKQIENKRYDIEISLTNNSDSIINFIIMTCSWDKSFIINTKLINDIREDCNSNYPRRISINPKENFTLTQTVEKSKYIIECETCPDYSKSVAFKLGFIYIPEIKGTSTSNEYSRIMGDKSLWNIIWSNALIFDKQ